MPESAPTIADFFGAWELFRDASLAGAMAGAALGLLGVYVVLRRLVFLAAAVSQAASLGVAITFWAEAAFGLPHGVAWHSAGAGALTLASILPLAWRGERAAPPDSLLGFGYLVGAAGTLAIGTRIVQDLHDIDSLLFGSAVAVLREDFLLVAAASAFVLGLHAWWWRGFAAVSFDPAGARVRGLPVRLLETMLFASLAIAVSVSTRVLGALPTFAFSVLPALAAVRLTRNVPQALAAAALFGAGAGFGGYLLAYLHQLPVGAAQTLVAAAFVAVAEAGHRGVRRLRP
jgi:zinc transport system permease protein